MKYLICLTALVLAGCNTQDYVFDKNEVEAITKICVENNGLVSTSTKGWLAYSIECRATKQIKAEAK